jgi:uncharacterized surface protein with fasciclin (FAS1) repeats
MVSVGPTNQSFDLKHLYEDNTRRFNDTVCENEKSICGILRKKFSKFFYILQLSGMMRIYNDNNFEITIFAPNDDKFIMTDLELIKMDAIEAIDIVKRHTVENRIPYNLLFSSNSFFLKTKHPIKKILVDSDPNDIVKLNRDSSIIYKNIICSNGIIHGIDKMF